MARSLGLATYRALARRAEATLPAPDQPRPEGQLVWLHAGEAGNLLAAIDLAQRLFSTRPDLSVLITRSEDDKSPARPVERHAGALIETPLPSENPAAIAAFLDHWQPDTCIWTWGGLRPNLILETAKRDCPLFLIDADTSGFDGRRDRWLSDLTRQVLSCFSAVFARSEAAQKRLNALGLAKDDIRVTTPLMAGGQALSCAETDLEELSAAMGGRSAWFAFQVMPKEIPIVLRAHQQALRLSHRLLLILNPAAPDQHDTLRQLLSDRHMMVASWDDGQFPDDTTQVLLADNPVERGLFYRVAPVSFMGSTLVEGGAGGDPFDAAALGSAVLYGPKVRQFMPSYTRLAAAGAARIVNDATALGTAVSRLIAPDQAATMAHAGWDVISQGAALTDQVVDLVQDALDRRMAT